MTDKNKENRKFKTGIEEYYIIKDNKKMQFGYTTGSCAAAAAKASARMLLGGASESTVESVMLHTPKGIDLTLEVLNVEKTPAVSPEKVSCGIMKDAGDDPDVTHGLIIYASVEKQEVSPAYAVHRNIAGGNQHFVGNRQVILSAGCPI